MRMDPPASDPVAMATMPPATAAAEPPLEPPGVREVFQGFLVVPKSRFLVNPVNPNSGVLVFPITMAPAALSRLTWVES